VVGVVACGTKSLSLIFREGKTVEIHGGNLTDDLLCMYGNAYVCGLCFSRPFVPSVAVAADMALFCAIPF
jgi:hypothetical protein